MRESTEKDRKKHGQKKGIKKIHTKHDRIINQDPGQVEMRTSLVQTLLVNCYTALGNEQI